MRYVDLPYSIPLPILPEPRCGGVRRRVATPPEALPTRHRRQSVARTRRSARLPEPRGRRASTMPLSDSTARSSSNPFLEGNPVRAIGAPPLPPGRPDRRCLLHVPALSLLVAHWSARHTSTFRSTLLGCRHSAAHQSARNPAGRELVHRPDEETKGPRRRD